MLNKDLLRTKIRNIQEYLKETDPVLVNPEKEIISNIEKLRMLERNFQLIVDAMLDINIHLIREFELKTPDDLQSTFIILAEAQILPYDFGMHLAPTVGLRNLLVHGYEKMDRPRFIREFKNNRRDFDEYLNIINNHLTR